MTSKRLIPNLLLGVVLLGLTQSILQGQGKVSFGNDSNHLLVLGYVLPADSGLGGGSPSGTNGAVTAGPLPSGITLVAGLYAGTNATSLVLQTPTTLLTETGVVTPGRIANRSMVLPIPGGTPQYFRIVVWDSAFPAPDANVTVPTIGGDSYIGYTETFTATPGTGITYPTIMPGGSSASTLPIQMNIVINAVLATGPPVIDYQPQSRSLIVGSNATLSVSAHGTGPLAYQWLKDGQPIAFATNSTYSLAPATLLDNGTYRATITNSIGTITSSGAAMQVLPYGAPSFRVNNQIAAGAVAVGGPATISMTDGFADGFIFFTLDGSTPTTSSPLYSAPFSLTNSKTIRAMGLSADFSQSAQAQALFVEVLPSYNLQVNVAGLGTVSLSPSGGIYASNTLVWLTAIAGTNWVFDHWAGDLVGSLNPTNLTVNGSKSVTAVFTATAYPLTISTPGGGSVTANGQTIGPNTYFPAGSNITVTATPASGWNFIRWQGTWTTTQEEVIVTMDEPTSVEAIFGTTVFTNISGNGEVALSHLNPQEFGSTVGATAMATPGSFFVTWSQAVSGTTNPASFVVTNATPTVGALFALIPAPRLALDLDNGYAGLTLQGVSGRNYRIEFAPSFGNSNQWTTLTNITLNGPVATWIDTSIPVGESSGQRRYYRAWTQ